MSAFRGFLIFVVLLTAFVVAPERAARALGDAPDSYFEPTSDVGCWKWNWYQHAYYDVCPVYVHPKAYMYPRRMHAAVRVKG